MKRRVLIFTMLLVALVATLGVNAQNVLDGAYVKDHNLTRKPMPYTPLREADVAWAKKVWRVIDLKEKINLPLYYPDEKIRDRKSLIDLIMDAIKEGTLTAYEKRNDEFLYPMTKEEITLIGIKGALNDSTIVTQAEPPYSQIKVPVVKNFERTKVIAYRVKEEWFFDKQRSMMDVRILGVAPMWYDEDDQGNKREPLTKVALFWIYFPEARGLFAQAETFNRFNDTERKTFDDIFIKRIFNSTIVKESNVYDRFVAAYKTGLDELLEAEKIKGDMFNVEHDLWEF